MPPEVFFKSKCVKKIGEITNITDSQTKDKDK